MRDAGITGKRIMDLGSQDVTVFNEPDLHLLEKFIADWGGDAQPIRARAQGGFPFILTARDAFTAAGFDYRCCDVDRRANTLYVDFNTATFDRSFYGQFDLVMNAGTTEHLANPVPAFFFMHQLCRKGGIIYNEVPLSGWLNHGLVNLTPKFWHTLQWTNEYEVLKAFVKPTGPTEAADGNFGGAHLDFIGNLAAAGETSSSIQIVFRKTSERGFIPPFDAVIPTQDGGKALGELVWGSLRYFAASGALNHDESVAAVDDFLRYQQLPYRLGPRDAAEAIDAAIRSRPSLMRWGRRVKSARRLIGGWGR
jgi:hypothetical protein